MGANSSKQVSESINNVVNSTVNNFMNSSEMSTDTTLSASQMQDVKIKAKNVTGCDLSFTQNMTIVSRVYSQLTSDKQLELVSQLDAAFKAEMQNQIEQKNSGINLGQVNVADIEQIINSNVINEVSNQVVNTLSNNINSAIVANQNQRIDLELDDITCPIGNPYVGGIHVAQNVDLESVIENTMKDSNIQTTINKVATDVETATSASTSQINDGILGCGIVAAILVVGAIVAGVVVGFKNGVLPLKKNPFNKTSSLKLNFGRKRR